MKNLCILTLLCGLFLPAFAQISIHVEDVDNQNGTETIIRGWKQSIVVSYYRNQESGILELIDLSVASASPRFIKLPLGLFLQDMYIDDDTLYFCGYLPSDIDTILSIGAVGYIGLSDFYSTNADIRYYAVPDVSRLKKIVEYNDYGTAHVVAIGVDEWGYYDSTTNYTYSRSIFFDCPDIKTNPSLYTKQEAYDFERYDEVLLTDNFVVFTGYITTVNALCYRRGDKYDPTQGPFDEIHFFPTSVNESASLLHSTAMYEDLFATSYMHIDVNGYVFTRIRAFDVASLQMMWSQEFSVSEKTEPKGLVYFPKDTSLLLMEDFDTPISFQTNFVFIDPLQTEGYPTKLEHREKHIFSSITTSHALYYIAGEGATWFLRKKSTPPSFYPDESCPLVEEFHIETIENIDNRQYTLPLTPIQNSIDELTDLPDVNIGNGVIICKNN